MTNDTICCISDCHLGYLHRLKKQRQEDYENAYKEAMEKALAEKPALIIFGGDLFHHSRPDAASMKLLIKTMMDAAASTQIVLCVGNHEIDGNIKTAYVPLFSDLHDNIHVLTAENPHIQLALDGKKVVIHGFHFLRNKEQAEETLKKITAEVATGGDVNILCLHQAVEGSLSPFEISLKALKEAAPKYDLILLGHVHKHQKIDMQTPAYYIGSTERVSFNESENKTGFLVFRDYKFGSPEQVPVSTPIMRRIKQDLGKKTPAEINSHVKRLIEENRDVKCLQITLDVEITGDYFDVKYDWEAEYPDHTVLSVSIAPKIREEAVTLESMRLDRSLIDEYFEKTGLATRKDLKDLCIAAYEKYSGN